MDEEEAHPFRSTVVYVVQGATSHSFNQMEIASSFYDLMTTMHPEQRWTLKAVHNYILARHTP